MQETCTFASLRAGEKPEAFNAILAEYPSVVPVKLSILEEQRLTSTPATLAKRKKEATSYLLKDELVTLVEWKLSHGTFRPSLKSLVQQNSEQDVQDTTTESFKADNPKDALAILTRLKGIGPATASLLLSTNDPQRSPFFSDELFRWVFWEDKPGCRWDRKIKYSAKEYTELLENVDAALNAQGIAFTALELEKIAYVLGRRQVDLASGKTEKESGDGEKSSAKKQVKRKATKSAEGSTAKKVKRNADQGSLRPSAATTGGAPRRSTRSSAKAAGS